MTRSLTTSMETFGVNMASGGAAESCFNFFVTDSRESGSSMGRFAGNAAVGVEASAAAELMVFGAMIVSGSGAEVAIVEA